MGLLTIAFVRDGFGLEEDDIVIKVKRSDPYYQKLNKLFFEGDHYILHQNIILPKKMKQEWETAYWDLQHHLSDLLWEQLSTTGNTIEWWGDYIWVPVNRKSLAAYWTEKLSHSITNFHLARLGYDRRNNN